ncbi:MAG TPA: hypothetical protein VD816_05530 [Ohtaekwangia sp.]|nr:hypothetical protein [Ohtaekwangia sp.]
MKNLLLVIALIAGTSVGRLMAQEVANKEKMKVFAGWIGRWQGEGSMQRGPGEPKKSTVDERIESKLDGTVMVVEGVGKALPGGEVVHHALGILSYDQKSDQYKFRTYLNDGRNTDAWFNVVGENNFQWGFDIPNGGKTRYSITLDPAQKSWVEIGEYTADGNNWLKFFEMRLTKKE